MVFQKKEKKERKNLSPAQKRIRKIAKIVLIVFGVIMAGLAAFIIPIVVYLNQTLHYQEVDIENMDLKVMDISMTEKERLADLKYLYEVAYLGNPNREEFEKCYDRDFEALYQEYQEYVKNCKSDCEFLCTMFAYLRDMPSGHTVMTIPSVQSMYSASFQYSYECTKIRNEENYMYSWEQCVKQAVLDYDLANVDFMNFYYVGGEYFIPYQENMKDPDRLGARLLSINGISPDEYAVLPLQSSTISYDPIQKKIYRNSLNFNDKSGEAVTITYETLDGKVESKELYRNYCYDVVDLLDYNLNAVDPKYQSVVYPEMVHPSKTKQYQIVEDEEYNAVYFELGSCVPNSYTEGMVQELKQAVEKYDTVILDLRYNSGGMEGFFGDYIYPYFYKDDVRICDGEVELGKSDITKKWASFYVNKIIYEIHRGEKGVYTYDSGLNINGNGEKDLKKLYVLISHTTFSSGDIIANELSKQENATLIGTNTGGEGIDGYIFNGVMPNSHLEFSFSPGKKQNSTEWNSVYGTAPDIYMEYTYEDALKKAEVYRQGQDPSDYEIRKEWDGILIETLKLIQEEN